jgi:iron complex transport system substrate-binding protein
VFWETWDEPLMSAGPGTFTGQVIEAAGGRNCFADSGVDWPVVSFEAVLARDPDYIMAAESHGAALTLERLARRVGWSSLKAVRAGRVVLLDGDIVSRAGPRLVDAIELMAGVLYPELFK